MSYQIHGTEVEPAELSLNGLGITDAQVADTIAPVATGLTTGVGQGLLNLVNQFVPGLAPSSQAAPPPKAPSAWEQIKPYAVPGAIVAGVGGLALALVWKKRKAGK